MNGSSNDKNYNKKCQDVKRLKKVKEKNKIERVCLVHYA